MIHSIISFSIRNKLVIGLFTLTIIVAGIWSVGQVPIDAVPDITNNQVQVITQAPSLGTEDIEQYISYPVELAMANLPGVLEIRSTSRFGLSVVTVVFEDGMGTYLPRQLVNEKLEQIRKDIPPRFGQPFIGPITTGLSEAYQYTLAVDSAYKDQYSLYDLRTMQDWIVRRQMAMVPGVIEVNGFGGAIKQYEVAINPHRLNAFGLTMEQVHEALENNNENTGGAYLSYDYRANFIRGQGLIKSLTDIENIVVEHVNGVPITVKQVAKVSFGNQVRYGAFTKNGEGEGVGGIILLLKGANANEVIKEVKERMALIEQSLPPGVSIVPFLDRSELIDRTTRTVSINLAEGALIVIFVLVFLLGNWRGGLIVASTIPIALLFAFILMNVFDVWANLMSLGAIDFGIIVDGAVIIVEGTVFMLYQRVKPGQQASAKVRDETAAKASKSMMKAAFFGQLIILIVFLPILALEGIEGKMFRPMALTFIFAMLGAVVLCLTYVPMMSAWFLRTGQRRHGVGQRFINWLQQRYAALLQGALKRGIWLVGTAVLLLGLAYYTFTRLGGEFIPRLDEGDVAFHDILKPGSSLEEALKVTTMVEEILLEEFPDEVDQVLSRVGVSDVPIDLMPLDVADCFLKFKPESQWTRAKTKPELLAQIRQRLMQVPGVNYEFTQPIEMRFNELMTGVRQDLAIKIFGHDLDLLAAKAQEVAGLVQNIEGVADLRVEATQGQPQITIDYNRQQLAFYGLDISSINHLVQSAFAGRKAGVVFEGERRFDLVLRLDAPYRTNMEDVQNLLVPLPTGGQVPLNQVATVQFKPGPMQISRDNTNRRTYVGINVRGRDVKTLIEEVDGVLRQQLDLPPGYYIRYGGAFENLQRATRRLQLVVPVALGLIFLLVYLALGSVKQTVMIYMAIPLAAIGGVFSLWVRDMPFSISAGIGFIVLFGIAVLNGLVLINGWNELKAQGNLSLKARIIEGTKRRIRPILLTAGTDILGFLPMALSTSAGAEVQRPLATVVIGGMLTATLLTLFVLPVLYQWLEKRATARPAGGSAHRFSKPVAAALVLLALGAAAPAMAQSTGGQATVPLTIEQATQRAMAHYPALKSAQLGIEKQQALRGTAFDFGRTTLFTAGEEVSSEVPGVVTVFGIQQQNIDLFGIGAKSKLLAQQLARANTEQALTALQVSHQVQMAYAQAYVAWRHWQLIQQTDSLYGALAQAVKLQKEVQSASNLAYLAAANQAQQSGMLVQQAGQDYKVALMQLNQWLATPDTLFTLAPAQVSWLAPLDTGVNTAQAHPVLTMAQNQVAVAQQAVKTQQAAYWPQVNLQYGLQQVGGQSGFYQYQAGLRLPLVFTKQKSLINAARVDYQMAQQAQAHTQLTFANQLDVARTQYAKWLTSWQFYQNQALPLAARQQAGSQLAFEQGAIDAVAYLQHLKAVLETQEQALQALKAYLAAKFTLQYLLNL